jgi:phenylacetic acid degradation operon negative regulatory protein
MAGMDPSPRSLILDLLQTLGRASAPVRALVAAASLFGIAENSLRVALARLRADGLVESDVRGSYRLGPAARAVSGELRSWRHLEQKLRPWDGAWVAVQTGPLARGSARERRRRARALRLLGLRPFAPGIELRPDNLQGGVEGVRARLASLGIDRPALVYRAEGFDPAAEAEARGLWGGAALVESYRATVTRLEDSAARLVELPREAAMVESFRLGGETLRQLALDPLLPEPIVPAAERRALVTTMHRYDRLGRQAWAGWLGGETELPAALPAGVHESGAEATALWSQTGEKE